jgi:ribosomal protein S1
VTSREIGLDLYADKSKYTVMSRDQKQGRSQNIMNDNNALQKEKVFKYLGTTITNNNFIQEEIKNILKSGNACIIRFIRLFLPGCCPKM